MPRWANSASEISRDRQNCLTRRYSSSGSWIWVRTITTIVHRHQYGVNNSDGLQGNGTVSWNSPIQESSRALHERSSSVQDRADISGMSNLGACAIPNRAATSGSGVRGRRPGRTLSTVSRAQVLFRSGSILFISYRLRTDVLAVSRDRSHPLQK